MVEYVNGRDIKHILAVNIYVIEISMILNGSINEICHKTIRLM